MAGFVVFAMLGSVSSAHAGLLDSLFGSSNPSAEKPSTSNRRAWVLHEFTVIRLVAREADAPPNQHPQQFNSEDLRRMLAQVRLVKGSASEPLFASDELGELIEPLVQAFENAGPNDDVQLLSNARRGGGVLLQPAAVTARLFVQGGYLQMIVNDARYEFMNLYIGSRKPPVFTYGSRAHAGNAELRSDAASAKRPDWLLMPVVGAPAVRTAPPAAVPMAPMAAPSVAAPVAAPADSPSAVPSSDIEQRLTLLKRLRDKGLITEEEYLQKRKEILSQL